MLLFARSKSSSAARSGSSISSTLPATARTGAIFLSAASTARPPTSPAWRISSTPASAVSACGLIRPCVSEIRPITIGVLEERPPSSDGDSRSTDSDSDRYRIHAVDMAICDAHCHFFSTRFFELLTKDLPDLPDTERAQAVCDRLQWQDPGTAQALADRWLQEMDRAGVSRAVLIASIPGDEDSVATA